ncbi:MAG: WYL domain-containing protein [Vicinamibacterales bacterium]
MARNAEMIRQWRVLREIEASHGVTIPHLAGLTGVTTRTIRRDLDALQEAGFALYDQTVDGRKHWHLDRHPFKKLDEVGFTLGELSALYFSRTLMECLSGTPFQDDLTQAFAKLNGVLGSRMRAFLDRLPQAIQAKPGPTPRRVEAQQRKTVGRLLDAVLHQQRVSMRYHSMASRREKNYRVDPYRLVYAQGGLYLFAYVPVYQQVRTFAVDRIRRLSPLEETFEVVENLGETVFAHSLGMHEGAPERVEVTFSPEVAPYVTERVWHQSQSVETADDGSVLLRFDVCTDAALVSWILSFGAAARVQGPTHLAHSIATELERAYQRYQSPASAPTELVPR